MKLAELFADTGALLSADAAAVAVTDITTSSRRARRGGIFLACAGRTTHGLAHVDDALRAGVAAVAWEPVGDNEGPVLPDGVVGIAVPQLSQRLGLLANRFFGEPSAALTVVGITGTNGKSTTAWLVAQALSALGRPAGYMGTLGFGMCAADAAATLQPSALTTPGCVDVHRHLRSLLDDGARYAVMEVSSHALDQGRVDGVRFDTAALTNISRDHLDYHGNMDRYAEAKARLFIGTGICTAVVNTGDARGAELAARLASMRDPAEVLSVALVATDANESPHARLIGRLTATHTDGIGVRLSGDFGDAVLESPLWGRFNAENLVVAAGILLAQGLDLEAAVAALGDCAPPPGRMQLVRGAAEQPVVVVDYAHTPDALGQALRTTREHTDGNVWCVFGCGGDRDRGKRAQMGEVVATLADRAIITDDNPRNEDPAAIVADIQSGMGEGFEVIRDRGDAIGFAIRSAGANDTVLVAGKGHERFQMVGDDVRPFSDVDAARAALNDFTSGGVA